MIRASKGETMKKHRIRVIGLLRAADGVEKKSCKKANACS